MKVDSNKVVCSYVSKLVSSYAVVTKGSVRFLNKASSFLKSILKDYKLSRLSVKARMRNWWKVMKEMRRITVGMRGMRWEFVFGKSAWECVECRLKCEKCVKSGWRWRKSRWKLNYICRNDISELCGFSTSWG